MKRASGPRNPSRKRRLAVKGCDEHNNMATVTGVDCP